MSEVKWIKIATDIFDDEKVLLIESMPDADAIIVIWLKLLVFAGKQNTNGVLMMNEAVPYTDEMLAAIFRRPLNTVRLALGTFKKFGMIRIYDDVITIPNWEKHQSLDKLEKLAKQNRERVRRHREKQKALAQCNVTEPLPLMQSNALDTNTDKDIDKDIDKGCCSSVLGLMSDEEVSKLFSTYEDADMLIDAVDEELSLKNKFGEIRNAYRYVIGYAENKQWLKSKA